MLSFLRWCRTILYLGILICVAGAIFGLYYLNQKGFPGAWGDHLQDEFAKRGVHLDFESVRYDLNRGVVAHDVSFFLKKGDEKPLFKASQLVLDLDKTKALRGKIHFHHLRASGLNAWLPVAGDNTGETKEIQLQNFYAEAKLNQNRRLVIEKLRGLLQGIHINLTANIILPEQEKNKEDHLAADRHKLIRTFLKEIERWHIETKHPPELHLTLQGNLTQPDKLETDFTFKARDLERQNYRLKALEFSGDLEGSVVTLDHLHLQDETGHIKGHADWRIDQREGRFVLDSKLQLRRFLRIALGISTLENLHMDSAPAISCQGNISLDQNHKTKVSIIGKAALGPFRFLGSSYENLSTDFSWNDDNYYLKNLKVTHEKGQLDGRIMMRSGIVQYEVKSTLPLSAYKPLIGPKSQLQKTLDHVKLKQNSLLAIEAAGTLNRNDLTDWEATGRAHISSFSYHNAPLHHLSAEFKFNPSGSEFHHINALVDDTNHPLALRFKSDPSQDVNVDHILFDRETKTVEIQNLTGTVWPSSIVAMFAPKTAGYLTREIRLHQAPTVAFNGLIHIKDSAKNKMQIRFNPNGPIDYTFLGKTLTFNNLQSDIKIENHRLDLTNLSFSTLGSPIAGNIQVMLTPNTESRYRGGLMWRRLSLPAICKKYQFKETKRGYLTGRLDFSGTAGKISAFNGKGLIGLEQGQLVSLPVLGPLSPLMAGVLGDKRAGYERAKNGSATFLIKNGIIHTDDLIATSSSVIITGDGWIDLNRDLIDLTVRLNARGLLGLVTLPFKPFNGLFEFKGTGKYTDPNWRSSPFSSPVQGNKHPIFGKPPKAREVIE